MPVKIVSPVRVTVRGRRHTLSCEAGELGVLEMGRGAAARFRPAEGQALLVRKEPGITASHYQMWNEKDSRTSEFFASSYRWSIFTREIRVHYGNNDYLLVPSAPWRRGYELVDNKGKRILSFAPESPLRSVMSVTVDKAETELACIVFTYFLARSAWLRSLWRRKPATRRASATPAAVDSATATAAAKAAELAKAMMPPDTRKQAPTSPAPASNAPTPNAPASNEPAARETR
jgi:hypothetical protein